MAHQANYAVIFISKRTQGDQGYAEAMERIEKLHKKVKAEGRRTWYSEYQIYFTRLERGHSWTREDQGS